MSIVTFRYSKRNLESMSESLMMCKCITELDTTNTANIQEGTMVYSDAATGRVNSVWLISNADGMTPLQLAAENGLFQIFEFIMNIEGVCSTCVPYFVSSLIMSQPRIY